MSAYYQWRTFARDVAITCGLAVVGGLTVATVADALLPQKGHAYTYERELIERTAEEFVGAKVLWARGHTNGCEPNLLGFYHRGKKVVVMCESNITSVPMLLEILKHETWHAVQWQCNGGRPVLNDDQLRGGMRANDRSLLRSSYPVSQHRLEAEARVIGQLPTPNFIDGVQVYCSRRT